MQAHSCSTSLITQISTPGVLKAQPGYYRSKLFSTPTTSNVFLTAASSLFSLLERLGVSQSLPPIQSVRSNLDHELKAFRSRLISFECADELAVIAQYLLNATIDELLGKNYLRVFEKAAEFSAFTPSSADNIGPEKRFFELVDYIQSSPNQYLDLIELAYYCLILGFEGEHHMGVTGRQTLDNLIEALHELIQKHRVQKPVQLFSTPKPPESEMTIDHKPWIKTTVLGIAVLFGTYVLSQVVLEHKAQTILTERFQPIHVGA
ncbi:MAG: type IVB secretion system protein IcmH/DotU [Gammaproteobacteria bacterium]|nr:type IVB secretion system protein IcmH/DotU [Gammaproteobacteria bacterium]MCH9717810.1 type IVB secretion system protein IcmH/DotU [Gammaproteobacteria bacterium]MCH9763751.1 type IVB secretion system protein IcmH/DotU [Gammaproteobacteria bacterium]